MSYQSAPILKASERLLLEIEKAVLCWARAHRFSHGVIVRQQAMLVAQLAHQAWREREHLADRLAEMSRALDNLKISLQLGKQLKAFSSFGQFEAIARLSEDLGRQLGGWRKQVHRKSQNASASKPSQRTQILSSVLTSQSEVHP